LARWRNPSGFRLADDLRQQIEFQTYHSFFEVIDMRELNLNIDKNNAWRVSAVAEREDRTLTSAANFLIQTGWDVWSAGRWDAMTAQHSKPENEPPKSESRITSVSLPLSLVAELHQAARAEKRNTSSMIRTLLAEALERRKVAHVDTGRVGA
jgi:hypothetical protein